MKDILKNINKIFDNRVRLGIMSVLMVNEDVDFNTMKELLGVTDGNLASHIKAIETEEYLHVDKQFVGKKPNTTYRITTNGRIAFKEHIDALEKLINST